MSHVIKRVSTPEVIVQYLIGRIREGEFGPGDQLPSKRQLQIRLGVGRLSLREGLARLRAIGIVRIEHGKDAYIQKTINRDTLVSARGLIEGELAGSVPHGQGHRASPGDPGSTRPGHDRCRGPGRSELQLPP